MSDASRFTLTFVVEHGEEGCGEPWDTGSLTSAVVAMLTERFGMDGLRIEQITGERITA